MQHKIVVYQFLKWLCKNVEKLYYCVYLICFARKPGELDNETRKLTLF